MRPSLIDHETLRINLAPRIDTGVMAAKFQTKRAGRASSPVPILYLFKLIQSFAKKTRESQDNFDRLLLSLSAIFPIVNSAQSGRSACGDQQISSTAGSGEFLLHPGIRDAICPNTQSSQGHGIVLAGG
jgi:hypothetical protein